MGFFIHNIQINRLNKFILLIIVYLNELIKKIFLFD